MGNQNPFQTHSTSAKSLKNDLGRPSASKSTHFGPQPQSIVSKILQKMMEDKKTVFPTEQKNCSTTKDIIYLDDDTDSLCAIEEADSSENYSILKPKKKNKTRCKEETKPKVHYCDYSNCSYNTKISSNLQKHKRVHTAEKPYLCDQCSFRTNFSNSLKVHKRLHTENRPYQCTNCDYKCNTVSNLKKHSLTKHKNNCDKLKT